MNTSEIISMLKEDFLLDESFVEGEIEKKNSSQMSDLNIVLSAMKPYLDDRFKNDSEQMRRAGRVILLDNDFSADVYSGISTERRLKRFFQEVTTLGINPYVVVHQNTLKYGDIGGTYIDPQDKHVKSQRQSAYDVNGVFNSIKDAFHFSHEETIGIVESAPATLLGCGTYERRIYDIRNTLFRLQSDGFYFFRRVEKLVNGIGLIVSEEINEAVKRCPSILAITPERMVYSFNYLKASVPADAIEQLHQEYLSKGNSTMSKELCKLEILRSWIKDNISILNLGSKIYEKEKFIRFELSQSQSTIGYKTINHNTYDCEFLFDNPVGILDIDAISKADLEKNMVLNLVTLEEHFTHEQIQNYIKSNPYVLGIENNKLKLLLNDIIVRDVKDGLNRKEKLLSYGKSLFAKNYKQFNADTIIKKLEMQPKIKKITFTKNSQNLLPLFVEVFCDDDSAILDRINNVIAMKNDRLSRGDEELRHRIRTLVPREEWPTIVKSPTKALKLVGEIDKILLRRFEVYQVYSSRDIGVLSSVENDYSRQIKALQEDMRMIFETKKNSLEIREKYPDLDIEKLGNYALIRLEKIFGDKEPIGDIFDQNITQPFINAMSHEYRYSERANIFGSKTLIMQIPYSRKGVSELNSAIQENVPINEVTSTNLEIGFHK